MQAILFGTAVVVSKQDLHRLACTGGIVLFLQLWWFRGFAFASFDPAASLATDRQGRRKATLVGMPVLDPVKNTAFEVKLQVRDEAVMIVRGLDAGNDESTPDELAELPGVRVATARGRETVAAWAAREAA